jgi:hypothetical protein
MMEAHGVQRRDVQILMVTPKDTNTAEGCSGVPGWLPSLSGRIPDVVTNVVKSRATIGRQADMRLQRAMLSLETAVF